MKKIENIESVDGSTMTFKELEDWFLKDIGSGRGKYKSPKAKLKSLINPHGNPTEQRIISFLFKQFEKVITASPIRLERIIKAFDSLGYNSLLLKQNGKLNNFGNSILDAFRYKDLRSTRLVNLAEKLNIKACLYCNSQYTLFVKGEGKKKTAKFQFDHFYPKSKYPYLSLSLYNLIPSCANCNQSKTSKVYSLHEFVHPYHDDFHNKTEFFINNDAFLRFRIGEKVPEKDINIDLKNVEGEGTVKNYNKEFALKGIYERHKDIIQEIHLKSYAYLNGGKEALASLKNSDGKSLFKGVEEIERILLANYNLIDDINKRPLSKFMQDIAREAGLIQ